MAYRASLACSRLNRACCSCQELPSTRATAYVGGARDDAGERKWHPNFGNAHPHAFITSDLVLPAQHRIPRPRKSLRRQLSSLTTISTLRISVLRLLQANWPRASCRCSLPNLPEAFSTSFHNALPHVGCSRGLPHCFGFQLLCCRTFCSLRQRFQGSIDLRCSPISSSRSWVLEACFGRPQARHHRSRSLRF